MDRYCREFSTKQTTIGESNDKKAVLLASVNKMSGEFASYKNKKNKTINPKEFLGNKYNSILKVIRNKKDIILKLQIKCIKFMLVFWKKHMLRL